MPELELATAVVVGELQLESTMSQGHTVQEAHMRPTVHKAHNKVLNCARALVSYEHVIAPCVGHLSKHGP